MVGSDDFVIDEDNSPSQSEKLARAKHITKHAFDPESYEFDDRFTPGNPDTASGCKTTHEIVQCLEKNKDIQIEGDILVYSRSAKKYVSKQITRKMFIESFKLNEKSFKTNRRGFMNKFREDSFDTDGAVTSSGDVGQDFVPILGGPFHKQLYTYDFLKMQAAAFWAYHHDPIAHRIVHTIVDFTLGKGYRIDFKDPMHSALWDAFEEANDLYSQMLSFARELSTYGESMWYWLPDSNTEIAINRPEGQQSQKGIIPRIRVMDPSMFWDIITQPEDISKPLAYQWVSPTQYQIYTHVDGTDKTVQGSKFIYKQIPAENMIHAKVNSMSNEKRGRSDLFSVLGYLKRLRDTVTYSIIGLQKNAAWSMDTTIQGGQSDIDGYISDQQSMGTIPEAGSEFVHTDKIKREYLSNSSQGSGRVSQAFEWCFSMIAAGSGIPTNYFGTHLSGGQTRASAVVATEPVAKLFEMRQKIYEQTMTKIIRKFFALQGIYNAEFSIKWPEIITQDRSQKIKDMATAETMGWFSPKRVAEMAAKEFGQEDFEFASEQEDIKKLQDAEPQFSSGYGPTGILGQDNPLTKPGMPTDDKTIKKPSAITGPEKVGIKKSGS